jgi:serine/threonine protein kinase
MDDRKVGKWRLIKELGQGGQGKVYLAQDTEKYDDENFHRKLYKYFNNITHGSSEATKPFINLIFDNFQARPPSHCGALKELHEAGHKKAEARIKNEIKCLSTIDHPNILKLLDSDPGGEMVCRRVSPEQVAD